MARDLIGQKFNSLTVIEKHPDRTASKKVQWKCLCDCGKETLAVTQHLLNGNTKSCGCRRVERTRQMGIANKSHGMTGSPEYKAWQSMKDRCYNEENENFHNYGGRGIVVWHTWMKSFNNFYRDMGPRPGPEYSIDRIDVNGNYRPSNCRWATAREQANNRRANQHHEFQGRARTLAEIARIVGLSPSTIATRLRKGKSIQEAVEGRGRVAPSTSS